jgi:RNA polymerase sigma-70 factor (ECF subfamily)
MSEAGFENYRPYLFSIAYRMLGSVMEAEDMVQETYLRYQSAARESIRSTKSWLSTVTTRLCLDHLRSARVQREEYIGPWLPEPILTGSYAEGDPAQKHARLESISMAFMVLLESLSPLERAVFLLREVFEYEYKEISRIVEEDEAYCRQLFHRAKSHLEDHRPRFEPSPSAHRRLVNEFMRVLASGETDGLEDLLVEDVMWTADGGGKVTAARKPVVGRETIVKLVNRLVELRPPGTSIKMAEVNGLPALTVYVDERLFGVMDLELEGDRIRAIRFVVNPDKLAHLSRGEPGSKTSLRQ